MAAAGNSHLEPPPKSRELEDPGADPEQSVESSDDEHFSDALENGEVEAASVHARSRSQSRTSRPTSPVPRTRVERVDEEPSYGEVPGSPAYEKRTRDAVPDEIAVQSRSASREGRQDNSSSETISRPHSSSLSVPRTVVEKVDTDIPSYGEDPMSPGYQKRTADAAPDYIFKAPKEGELRIAPVITDEPDVTDNVKDKENTSSVEIPETRVSRVDTLPAKEKKRISHRRNPSDAQPDYIDDISETGSPSRSRSNSAAESRSSIDQLDSDETKAADVTAPEHTLEQSRPVQDNFDDFNDDFDDFEAGDANAAADDDDFGDFGNFETTDTVDNSDTTQDGRETATAGAAAAITATTTDPEHTTHDTSFSTPILDFDSFPSLSSLLQSSQSHLDALFPSSTTTSSLPPVSPIPDASAIFITDRSRSLWTQLVAAPPLQPVNWVKSRIRRLFLVSMGVPVDLDQILPAKKQKKLVLYSSTTIPSSTSSAAAAGDKRGISAAGRNTQSNTPTPSRPGSRSGAGNGSGTATPSRRQRPGPPELDFTAVRQLYSMTDEALNGLTDDELREHIAALEDVMTVASKVLEYWLQKKDRQLDEKEAFEGVIENLVKHARQVRK